MAIPVLGTVILGKAHPTDLAYFNLVFKGPVSQNSHGGSYGFSIWMGKGTILPQQAIRRKPAF